MLNGKIVQMYIDSEKVKLFLLKSWKSLKEARRVGALQVSELPGQKDLPLSLNHVLDNVWTKMLNFEVVLINSGYARV